MNFKRKTMSLALAVTMLTGAVPANFAFAEANSAAESRTEYNFSTLKMTSAEKDGSVDNEVVVTFDRELSSEEQTDFVSKVVNIKVNGEDQGKPASRFKMLDGSYLITLSEDKADLIAAGISSIEIKLSDGTVISNTGTTAELGDSTGAGTGGQGGGSSDTEPAVTSEGKTYELGDKLEDGVYTLSFRGLNMNDHSKGSMMEGTFDSKVKLTVENGKKKIEMLNHTFAVHLITFAINNDGKWFDTDKTVYNGEYVSEDNPRNIFTFELDDLTKEYESGVLVAMIGDKPTDKGNYGKYTKFILKFVGPIKEGFDGYAEPKQTYEEAQKSNEKLIERLKQHGADINGDGEITPEELYEFSPKDTEGSWYGHAEPGVLDLGYLGVTDVSILKNLGPNVKSINLGGNNIKEIPADLFHKAVNLESISLTSNKITAISPDQFSKNKKLKSINLNSNPILILDKDTFAENTELDNLEISKTGLKTLPEGIFRNNAKLATVYMPNNEIESLPDSVFEGTAIKFVDLNANNIKSLPSSIGQATLTNLSANAGEIRTVPESLSKAEKLKTLDLSGNLIEELPEKVWVNLAANNATAILKDNLISNIPVDKLGKPAEENGTIFSNIEIAMNNFPEDMPENFKTLGVDPKVADKYHPQKSTFALQVSEKDGKIVFSNKEPLEYLLTWINQGEMPSNLDGVKEYLKKEGKTAQEYAKESFTYTIKYAVEKKTESGFELIAEETLPASEDDREISVNDPNKKAGDIYRIRKVLSKGSDSSNVYRAGTFETEYLAQEDTLKPEDAENAVTYEVPIKLMHAVEEKESLGAKAVAPKAKVVEKDGKSYIYLDFKGINFMKLNGHVVKLYHYVDGVKTEAQVIKTAKEPGLNGEGIFPTQFLIERNALKENVIKVAFSVDAMEEIQPGSEPDARLVLEWDKAEKVKNDQDTPGTGDNPGDQKPDKDKDKDKDDKKEEKKYDSDRAYIDGYEDGTFKPDQKITRAEATKILAYALTDISKNKGKLENHFKDIADNSWYKNAVLYMSSIGAVEGYEDGMFKPDDHISRAEFATIIAKIDGHKDSKEDKFKDVPKKHWAKSYIEDIASKGYIKGYPDGTFKAENTITRAEVVAIVNRMLEKNLDDYKKMSNLKVFKDVNKKHWAYWDIEAATNKLK